VRIAKVQDPVKRAVQRTEEEQAILADRAKVREGGGMERKGLVIL